ATVRFVGNRELPFHWRRNRRGSLQRPTAGRSPRGGARHPRQAARGRRSDWLGPTSRVSRGRMRPQRSVRQVTVLQGCSSSFASGKPPTKKRGARDSAKSGVGLVREDGEKSEMDGGAVTSSAPWRSSCTVSASGPAEHAVVWRIETILLTES